MNFSWVGIKKSFSDFWGKLSHPQKVITVVIPLVVTIALFVLIFWASRPQYVAIFNDLADTEAGTITAKLKELKVDYKLDANGSTISVPKKDASEVRLQLATAGLPQGSKFSWDESLNQMHLGETDADRKLRYTVGLQTELEATLERISGVEDARVHIVLPDQSLFVKDEKPTTASVTLKIAVGKSIKNDQVKAIANLVSSSVEGLKFENITIVDTTGNSLTDALKEDNSEEKLSATQLELQKAKEKGIQDSVQSMLERVYPEKTVVRATVELDFDKVVTNTVVNGPGAVVSEQNLSEKTGAEEPQGAVPGVDTNIPGYQTPATSGNTTSEKVESTKNYQPDTTQQEVTKNQGDIKRLSVSVLVDADSIDEQQAEKIKTIVASASGVQLTRGDEIQVEAVPFDKTARQQQERALAEAMQKQQMNIYIAIGIGVLIILILVVVFFVVKGKRRKEELYLRELENTTQPISLMDAENAMNNKVSPVQGKVLADEEPEFEDIMKKSNETLKSERIKSSIENFMKNNPDDVSRLLRTWITEEK